MHGVLVIDKPLGPTSHDVVAQLRRVLKTKRVGHAGTLDPLASGVLVVAVGEGTKLVPYLTAGNKAYDVTIKFGEETLSLDAGSPVSRALAIDPETLADIGARGPRFQAATLTEHTRTLQVPPQVTAIHVDGVRAHERVRRGEVVDVPARDVKVHALEYVSFDEAARTCSFRLCVSKGYYVRAFARDFAESLGTLAHVTALRRTASGSFNLSHASSVAEPVTMSLTEAAKACLPMRILNDFGALHAAQGKPITNASFLSEAQAQFEQPVGHAQAQFEQPVGHAQAQFEQPVGHAQAQFEQPVGHAQAWFAQDGRLVAIGSFDGESGRVLRGFSPS
jgi:tRNA pseudouridine55 synthase